MDIETLRKMLASTLALNIKGSSVVSEILFRPSFINQGQTVFCQIRQRDDGMFICYEHFNKYEFYTLSYTKVSSSFNDNVFTDSFCGIIIVDKKSQAEIEELICKISTFKSLKTDIGLDGYSHTVIINDCEYYWWYEPVSKNAILCDKLVSKVFTFLPEDFRKINIEQDV